MSPELKEFILTMAPQSEETGYWPKGIQTACSGNDHMKRSMADVWKGNIETARREKQDFISGMAESGVPLIVVPYPNKLVQANNRVNYDIEYFRDPLIISRATGEALLFAMGEPSRRGEIDFHKELMGILGIKYQESSGAHKCEGGNIRRIQRGNETWFISATSVRTDAEALRDTADFLKVPASQRVTLSALNSFHLDCALMAATTAEKVHIATWRAAFDPDSSKAIDQFTRQVGAEVYELAPRDTEILSPNQLQVGDTIFGAERFTDTEVAKKWLSIPGLKFRMSKLTQTQRTGGSNHCLTTEAYLPADIDPREVNRRLKESGVFEKDDEILFYNH